MSTEQAELQSTISGKLISTTREITPPQEDNRTNYTNEDRKNFAVLYVMHGSVKAISGIMEIPVRTLYNWLKADWWNRYYDEAKREYAELIEARLSDIVEQATRELIERLQNGDEVLTRTGGIVRVKVSAKDLGVLIKDGVDKIRLLQNKPSKMTAELKVDYKDLERNFAELADKYRDRVVATQ